MTNDLFGQSVEQQFEMIFRNQMHKTFEKGYIFDENESILSVKI